MPSFPYFPSLLVNRFAEQRIWLLAWPIILANISTPLLGFVDTAVVGHLPDASYLAGTALGSLLITVLFWLMGFLRMSTTGLVAQAEGRNDKVASANTLIQGIALALALGCSIVLFQDVLFGLLNLAITTEVDVSASLKHAELYFSTRVWIAPISLINLVLLGYAIGIGRTKVVLQVVLIGNLVNLAADILFVPVLGFGVAGVAMASVIAEICQFVALIWLLQIHKLIERVDFKQGDAKLSALISMNSTLFLRSALLQSVISFMAIHSSRYGDDAIALNAILMQFFLFISFAMDGIAFGLESLVGKAYGGNKLKQTRLYIQRGGRLALRFALLYTALYLCFAFSIVSLLTDIPSLLVRFESFYWLVVVLPLLSFLSFIFDGVFVALAWVKQMCVSMAIAACVFGVCVVVSVYTFSGTQLQLWGCFVVFLCTRWMVQGWMLKRYKLLF